MNMLSLYDHWIISKHMNIKWIVKYMFSIKQDVLETLIIKLQNSS